MWSLLSKALSFLINNYVVQLVIGTILKFAGLSGGIWTWIVSLFVKKAASEIIEIAGDEASHQDQLDLNAKLDKEYQELIDKKASEEELIKKELEILNGKRKP